MLLLQVSMCYDIINVYRNLDNSYLFSFFPWYFHATFAVIITFQWLKVSGKKLFSSFKHPYLTFIYFSDCLNVNQPKKSSDLWGWSEWCWLLATGLWSYKTWNNILHFASWAQDRDISCLFFFFPEFLHFGVLAAKSYSSVLCCCSGSSLACVCVGWCSH